jgi:hypothetical protein
MFHREEYAKFVSAGYMSADPRRRQEVFSDGDNVTGNSLEPGGWSLEDDAYKPGRSWINKSFYMNPVYESEHLHRMFKKCNKDFATSPTNTSYLIVVPHMANSTWWKAYAKDYETIVIYPKGSLIFTARADTTYDSANLQPSGDAGGPHRVFVGGTPWPVAVLYRDAHTVPVVDPVLLSHLRFGHADCRRIDALIANNIPIGINMAKGEATISNPSTNCAVCKLVKAPRPGRFPRGDPQRHQWREANAYLSTDICGPLSPTERPESIAIKTDAESVHHHGIQTLTSSPYEHERNGTVEKTLRDIGDLARTMMATSSFPADGWVHAYRHPTWLKNRLPAVRLENDTPYYRMYGVNYDLSRVRIFGCRAIAHIPSIQLEPLSAKDLYVGHDDASAAIPLPVDPTELFHQQPQPDTAPADSSFDVIGLGAWYNEKDHELVALLRLRPSSSPSSSESVSTDDRRRT